MKKFEKRKEKQEKKLKFLQKEFPEFFWFIYGRVIIKMTWENKRKADRILEEFDFAK